MIIFAAIVAAADAKQVTATGAQLGPMQYLSLYAVVTSCGLSLYAFLREKTKPADTTRVPEGHSTYTVKPLPLAHVTMNVDGRILSFNHAAEHLFGYSSDEIFGRDLSYLLPCLDTNAESGLIADLTRWSSFEETVALSKDGERFSVELCISNVKDTDAIVYSVIARDVTQRRSQDEDIQTAISELKRSNRDLERFAFAASHDLKSPLKAIKNLTEWLEDCLLYTSPSPRDRTRSRMPSSA